MTIRDKIRKIQYWYMDRIINKWDKKTLSCDEATEKSTDKLLTLIKQVVEECLPKKEDYPKRTDKYPDLNDGLRAGWDESIDEMRKKLTKLLK